MEYVALFCRKDSDYKQRPRWDVYDAERNALSYEGFYPVVCHPPCRLWGRLSHMACRDASISEDQKQAERNLALWSIYKIRQLGGIMEHPSGSRIWDHLPKEGEVDDFGGFVIEIDQYDFGHVAHKMTKLYICGLERENLPPLPEKDETVHLCEKGKRRSICGNVKGTTRCTQKQREYTPSALVDWFELALEEIVIKSINQERFNAMVKALNL
jgi:hypothetical protein